MILYSSIAPETPKVNACTINYEINDSHELVQYALG